LEEKAQRLKKRDSDVTLLENLLQQRFASYKRLEG
jgi:hypothetical protein